MFFYFNIDKVINKGGIVPLLQLSDSCARAGNFSDAGSNRVTSFQNLIYDPLSTVSPAPALSRARLSRTT